MNEKLQRIVTRNPLIPLAVVLLGSVWFTLSILAFCVGLILPWTRQKPPASLPPRRGNSGVSISAPEDARIPPSILTSRSSLKHYHVTIQEVTPRPAPHKRWSTPAGFTPFSSKSTSIVDSESSNTLVDVSPRSQRDLPHTDGTQSPGSPKSTLSDGIDPVLSRVSSIASSVKTPLSARLPKMTMFKSRRNKEEKQGRHSRSGSVASSCSATSMPLSLSPVSTPPKNLEELKPEPETANTPRGGETFRTTFVSPFKFRPKRASASAAMMSSSFATMGNTTQRPDASPSPTPSAPASPDRFTQPLPDASPSSTSTTPVPQTRQRRRPFATYLNLSLSIKSSIPSPSLGTSRSTRGHARVESMPSASTSSTTTASASHTRSFTTAFIPSSAKTPKTAGPVPRTQPYGAPYFAQMPTGDYARKRSGSVTKSRRRRPSRGEREDHDVSSRGSSRRGSVESERSQGDAIGVNGRLGDLATATTNALGLSLGQVQDQDLARRQRRGHRKMASESMVR